jgi:C1A family cysteine protease
MKGFVLLLSFVLLAACIDQREEFELFVQIFQKVYPNEEARERAFQNFLASKFRIENLNKRDKHATYKINEFSDLSPKEFAAIRRPSKVPAQALAKSCLANGVTVSPQYSVEDIPTSWDWRTKGVVTPVKNQGQCGSCWAFSTTGAIESQWAIKGNKLTEFSEQLLVDCSHGCSNEPPYGNVCNQGCNGGWQWNAYIDIEAWGGLETEEEYPYTAVTGECKLNKKLVTAGIKNYTCLSAKEGGANETDMAAYLVQHGPLAIAMDASLLQDYSSGIIDPWFPSWECDPTTLDHALLLVGYGEQDSTPFWIIKNSWGSSWGESGYFRIVRGKGTCGLNNAVSAVEM